MKKLAFGFILQFVGLYSLAQWNSVGYDIYYNTPGYVGVGTSAPRSKMEVQGVARYSSAATGSSIMIDGTSLPTSNNWSNVRLVAGGDGGSGYLKTQLDNWGGYFSWARGSESGDVEVMRINASNGNVGIGTSNPQAQLHLKSGYLMSSDQLFDNINIKLDGTNIPVLRFTRWTGSAANQHNAFVGQFYNADIGEYSLGMGTGSSTSGDQKSTTPVLTATLNGNIGIGTTNPGFYKLAVEGKIGARKVVVTQNAWADYVFDPTYKLPTLQEVEYFIKKNKHLPDVPSAKEVAANGLDLGDNQAILLKKIEEQMLYIFELNKQLKEQAKTIEVLQQRLSKLEK